MNYAFGPFRLDAQRRILYSGTMPTTIPERICQVLCKLLDSGGEIVTREALAYDVWGEDGVTDTNVNQHVYLLRVLLGEKRGEPGYILTIPGVGYRFAAPVTLIGDTVQDANEGKARDELWQRCCGGWYLADRLTATALNAAARTFEGVLAVEPDYGPALIGLAHAHAMLATYGFATPAFAFSLANAAITRALRNEPASAIGHAVLAEIRLFGDWDTSAARTALTTAMQLSPETQLTRVNVAWYHVCRGEARAGWLEAAQVLFAEPSSLPLQVLAARMLLHAGDHARAIEMTSNVLAVEPDCTAARRYRVQALLLADRVDEAMADLAVPNADTVENRTYRLPLLARAWSRFDRVRAIEYDGQLRSAAASEYVPSWALAISADAAGRRDEAVALLRAATRERDPGVQFLRSLDGLTPGVREAARAG